MANHRKARPVLERLESRELLIGFYEGPAKATLMVHLKGEAQGVATFGAPKAHSAVPSVTIGASGSLTYVGAARVSGTLSARGGVERGTLQIGPARGGLTLTLVGPVPNFSSPSPARFSFSARGQVPGSAVGFQTASYANEQGNGRVDISFASVNGREKVTLVFSS